VKSLIVGIGNVGETYAGTRHNIGFDILDHLARKKDVQFVQSRHAFITDFRHKGRPFHVVKPTTLVNLSGKAVNYWMKESGIALNQVLVVTDDVSLPIGKIRLRKKGSDGGHNGLRNIIDAVGSGQFPRLRFGIGNDFPKAKQVDYVLGKWTDDQKKQLEERIELASDAILKFGTAGIERAMNEFNSK
jgi:PTH1 family peptidyl-tRNA hydrolase